MDRMWPPVDPQALLGSQRFLPISRLWNVCPTHHFHTWSCFKDSALRGLGIAKTIWAKYVMNPVKASAYNGCGRCGDLLIWRAPKPSLPTYPSGEVRLFLWSLLGLIVWAPVCEPTENIILLKLNHYCKFFFLLLHFSVLTQQLLSSDYIFFLSIVFCILSLGIWHQGLPWWLSSNDLPANAGDACLISGSGMSPGGGNDNPLQYSCLENPTDRGAWWATVHGVAKESDRI